MRLRIGFACFAAFAVAGFAALSLLHGEERAPAPPAARPVAVPVAPAPVPPASSANGRDFSKYNSFQQEMLLDARRGAEWLSRMNNGKGRFVHGLTPSLLDVELEGDNYLRQAGAAFALARAARFLREDRYAARATQAVLVLLDDTVVLDPKKQRRRPAAPSSVVNRVGAAGLLILAINELPDPQDDLLGASEQLCNFLQSQDRPDGSLCCVEPGADGKRVADETDAVNNYAGLALYALMRSQSHRPAEWKTELVRKAVAFYRPGWQAHKNVEFVPWITAACGEAYQRTKEKPFADFVFEMNDWLCGLQYDQLDAQRPLWFGGFKAGPEGPDAAPTVGSAFYAEGLADACRTARQAGDLDRYRRYGGALQLDLQFVGRLQYTEAAVSHFAEWYRPRLVGGFHASQQDGDLRIDYTQHALSALVQFLDFDLR